MANGRLTYGTTGFESFLFSPGDPLKRHLISVAGLLVLTAGCSSAAGGPTAKAPVTSTAAQAATSTEAPPSASPDPVGSTQPPELVAGADFSTPEAAGYTVMKALAQLPVTKQALLPYLSITTPASDASDLTNLDASLSKYKVKSLTALHVLVADAHMSVRTADYAEVEYSFNGTWCYTDGHCTTGDTKPYLKFDLKGGQWKMIINDVAYLLEPPSA